MQALCFGWILVRTQLICIHFGGGELSWMFPSPEPNACWDSVQSKDPLERIKRLEKIQEFITDSDPLRAGMQCFAEIAKWGLLRQ